MHISLKKTFSSETAEESN